jgi:hypothetical protein
LREGLVASSLDEKDRKTEIEKILKWKSSIEHILLILWDGRYFKIGNKNEENKNIVV